MSEKDACPNSSDVCEIPKPLSCSFRGCYDPVQHDKAYEVITFGPTGKMLSDSVTYSFCGKDTTRKVHIQSYNESLGKNEIVEDVMDLKPCSGPNSVSIEGDQWPCLVVSFGSCGPESVSFEPSDHIGEWVTQCGDEVILRQAGDNCGDALNQCWKIDFIENEALDEAFIVAIDHIDLFEPVASEAENTIEDFIKKNGLLNDKKFLTTLYLKRKCKGNNKWDFEDIP